MKIIFFLTLMALSSLALAHDVKLKDFDWTVTDILSRGLNKEKLFTQMDRDFIKVHKSICSNRALMWTNNFKTQLNLDTAKVFIFYTKSEKTPVFATVWWYHVSPVVNDNGNLFVLDPAFPGNGNGPQTLNEWFYQVSTFKTCHEIKASETELVELIYTQKPFPKDTSYGHNDCYYKVVPGTFWNPRIVVENLLGKDDKGNPVRTERPEFVKDELYQACVEATTSKFGWAMGNNKKECKEYAGL